jgi:hypothetical protein
MPPTASPLEAPYVRGASGRAVAGRRVVTIAVAVCLLAVAAIGIALAVEAARYNTDIGQLKRHGVAVEVTVTGCVGVLSGTGITASGYTCRGRYLLGGESHDAVIRGTSRRYPDGTAVRAVALAHRPTILYTAAAVAGANTSWRRFDVATGLLLGAAAGAVASVIFLGPGRPGRRPAA